MMPAAWCAVKQQYAVWRNIALPTILAIALSPMAAAQQPAAHLSAQPPAPLLIGYLPAYKGEGLASSVRGLDLRRMTHLDLAFGNPPRCGHACTSQSDMTFRLNGQSDADIDSIVATAHAAGVKVLLSIGGGGGDQLIIQFYNAGLSAPLVASLDNFLRAHNLDGVDLDIEDPANMGAPYAAFVSILASTFHPQGKLVTAAVAKYLQDSMPDSALHQFDFISVMNYSSYDSAAAALRFYAQDKKVPKAEIVLGVPFFAANNGDSKEEDYGTILESYPNAWKVDMVGGGLLDDGQAFHYVGESTMTREAQLGKEYGGVMIWQLLGDAAAPHSLLSVIRDSFETSTQVKQSCSCDETPRS